MMTGGEVRKTAPTLARLRRRPRAARWRRPVAGGDDVDPLAEADLYLNFGRDAQAEEVLKEAIAKNPQHEEAQAQVAADLCRAQGQGGIRKDRPRSAYANRGRGRATGLMRQGWATLSIPRIRSTKPASRRRRRLRRPRRPQPILISILSWRQAPANVPPPIWCWIAATLEKTMMMRPGELAGMSAAPSDSDQRISSTSPWTPRRGPLAAAARRCARLYLEPAGGADSARDPDLNAGVPGADKAKASVTGDSAAPMVSAIDFNFDAPGNGARAAENTTARSPSPRKIRTRPRA